MNKYNAKFNGKFNISEKFEIGAMANYSNISIDKIPGGQSTSNPLFTVYSAPVSYDLAGKPYSSSNNKYIQKHYRPLFDNPYWALKNNSFNESTERLIGNLNLKYEPYNWLKVVYRLGIDNFTTIDEQIYSIGSGSGRVYPERGDTELPSGGSIEEKVYNSNQLNSNLQFILKKEFGENLRIDGVIGNEIYDKNTYMQNVFGEPLTVPGFYNISSATNQSNSVFETSQRGFGYYAQLTVDYKGMLFFTPSGRADRVSNMPEGDRTFFYPSAALAFLFTELRHLKIIQPCHMVN